ncbi:hypothetical protein N7488_006971 [Penicillium malachiteum]|nr:hypothetical protein N7488_006971 [Penicillium malachiteum]
MRQSRSKLTPWLMLVCAATGAWAGKRPFNIHDDLLAYPQFQVKFPDEYILDSHAEELLRTQDNSDQVGLNADQRDTQIYTGKAHTDDATQDNKGIKQPRFAYEEMILDDRRLLCQIPQVQNDETNSTTGGKPSEADEAKELARATDRGLELLRELEGKCMYYFSGWWSYSFCYQEQIKQFHALPAGRGTPHYPPAEDPNSLSFVLGQFPADSQDAEKGESVKASSPKSEVAELHTKGGSRYLVQHLQGGTKCDLTGRERRIEVQFHCHPQSTDQIGWIKELTTCSYLMVIYTPRLCDDIAFMPPQQDEINNIECREILMPEDVAEWEEIKEWYLAHRLVDEARAHEEPQFVGGIQIGGRQLVGMEGKQIEKGRVAPAGEDFVEVLAKRENGEVKRMSKQGLKSYNLDPERLEEMKKRLEELAGDGDWILEVVGRDGEFTIKGIIDSDDTEETESDAVLVPQRGRNEKNKPNSNHKDATSEDGATEQMASTHHKRPETPAESDSQSDDSEGSEETFKDEL